MLCQHDVVVPVNISSPMATYYSNPITRKFITNSDLFNIATIFFRKVTDTISALAQFDFEEKVQHFHNIHDLIK